MFDIGWIELLVIATVAVLVVGPKDLPRMLRAFGRTVGKMKRMANQFQGQFNEALREAEIEDVKRSVEAMGDPVANIRRELESADKVGREIGEELMKPAAGEVPKVEDGPAKTAALTEAAEPDREAAARPAVADGRS